MSGMSPAAVEAASDEAAEELLDPQVGLATGMGVDEVAGVVVDVRLALLLWVPLDPQPVKPPTMARSETATSEARRLLWASSLSMA